MTASAPASPVSEESRFEGRYVLYADAIEYAQHPSENTRVDLSDSFLEMLGSAQLLDTQGAPLPFHIRVELERLKYRYVYPKEPLTLLGLQPFLKALEALYKFPFGLANLSLTPVLLSDKLAEFLGLPSGSKLSRVEISVAIHAYCEKHGLMEGLVIKADAALTELLNLQPGDFLLTLNLHNYLRHLYTI